MGTRTSMSDRFKVEERIEDYDCGCVLIDTKTGVVVFDDRRMEPEDATLCRDLSVFVDLLNELANG